MNSVEQAIRAAIAKGDEGDQAFRRKVYGSASAALERSIAARPLAASEVAIRRESLLSTIKTIESEYLVAIEEEAVSPDVWPETEIEEKQPQFVPQVANVETQLKPNETKKQKSQKLEKSYKIPAFGQSRRWAKLALNIGLLVAIMIGGFWVFQEGKTLYQQATSSKPSSQKPVLAENKDAGQTETNDWIQIFSATDTDLITSAQGAKAEIINRDGTNYVLLTGGSTNEIAVKIGAGLMQTFAGKRILLNFKARSASGATLDTGMYCEFGKDTKCERKRFKISPEIAEFMFAINVAASSDQEGALLIAPDLTNGGGQIEIENIRAMIIN
ncbi:MAG: hypothetical protein ACRCT6_10230 [Notoacmeibacter sp.]